MKLIKGKDLTSDQLRQVLSAYVHRFHAIGPDKFYKTEKDWILDHAFYFTKQGRLSNRHKHCEPAFMAE